MGGWESNVLSFPYLRLNVSPAVGESVIFSDLVRDPKGLDDGDEDEDEDDNQAIRRFQLPSYSSGGLPPLKSWWQVNSFDDHDPGDDDYSDSREDEDQNFTLWGFGDPHLSRIG